MKNSSAKTLLHSQVNLPASYFAAPRLVQFLCWLLLVLLFKHHALVAAPVWDTAMGVFPPAIFLYENSFDYVALSKELGWWDGGPNVHTFSLWTLVIALVMTATENPVMTFTLLHGFTFIVSAWAIFELVTILEKYGATQGLAILSGALLFVLPVVLVQIGYMYTETIVMALGVLAWASVWRNQEVRAVIFSILALSVKLTGVVIVGIIFLLLVRNLFQKMTIRRLSLLLSLIFAVVIVSLLPSWLSSATLYEEHTWGDSAYLSNLLFSRLIAFPDVLLLILIGCISAIVVIFKLMPKSNNVKRRIGSTEDFSLEGSRLIVLLFPFVFLLGIIFMNFQGYLFLQRYVVPMIPFSISQIVLLAILMKFQRPLAWFFAVFCTVSLVNYNGILYQNSNSFSIVESSHAYQKYVRSQIQIIERMQSLEADIPIFVSREIDYMSSHEMYGYVFHANANTMGIYKQKYSSAELNQWPNDFYVVFTNPGHGGDRIRSLIRQARESEDWVVDPVHYQRIEDFKMYIRRLTRKPRSEGFRD